MLPFLAEFLGRFHPVLVHLPIGILLLAAVLYGLSFKARFQSVRPAVELSLLAGMLSAMAAGITGYLLSTLDDYDAVLVTRHQSLGIITSVLSALAYFAERRRHKSTPWLIAGMVVALTLAGHFGGSLTHGEGYLVEAFANYSASPGTTIKPIDNVQEANAYEDVVRPILESRCYSCHSRRKQKGGLRLDEVEFILKGSKNGAVIERGDVSESELVNRLLLPAGDEDHMPPRERPQPTRAQIDLITWWIANGAPADKKVNELKQSTEEAGILIALERGIPMNESGSVPPEPVSGAQGSVVHSLGQKGVVIVPVSQGSNYLSANFVNAAPQSDSLLVLLSQIGDQLIWLKLSGWAVTDEDMIRIGQLEQIRRLHLDNTGVSDAGIIHLARLSNLQYLNLAGTNVTAGGVLQLRNLPELRSLCLSASGVDSSDQQELTQAFPSARIEWGGYRLPMLAGDTTEVTAARRQ